MNKKRKIIIGISVAVAIILLAVCLLPLPRAIQYDGMCTVFADGTSQGTQKLQVKGWYLDRLFLDDTIKLDITVGTHTLTAPNWNPVYQMSETVKYSSCSYYREDLNRFSAAGCSFDPALSEFCVRIGNTFYNDTYDDDVYYVFAIDPDADMDGIYSRFSPYT